MAKRKREVSPTSSAQSSPAQSSNKAADASPTHKRQKGGEEPKIVYQLADGSKRLERRLSRDKTLVDALYKVTKKLRITTPGSIRLSQVRQGGREVEIYDEFDYKAFKERAKASSEDQIIVTVYPGSRPGEAPSSPISSFSTPSSHAGPSSRPDSPVTPRSILSTSSSRAGPSTPNTHNKPKGKKRVSILEPHSNTPKTPEHGRPKPSPSRGSSKGKGKSVDPMVSTVPDVATNKLSVPEGVTLTPNVLRLWNKYKPAQPSPLSKPTRMDSDTSDSESPVKSLTGGQNNQTPPKKRVRLRRNRKSLPSSEADPAGHSPAAKSTLVADTVSGDKTVAHVSPEGSGSTQLPLSASPSNTASSPSVATSAPSALESAGLDFSSSSAHAADVSVPAEEGQTIVANDSVQTPQRRRKAKNTQSISTDTANSPTMSPSLEPAIQAPSPSDLPVDTPEVTPTTDAVVEDAPSRSKVLISMASPWNLFNKPAEPAQTGNYSSSSIDSPKKGKKGRKSKRESLAANDVAQETEVSTHQESPAAESSVAEGSNAVQVTASEPAVSSPVEVNASEKDQASPSTRHDTVSISEPSAATTQPVQLPSTPAPATPGSIADSTTATPVTTKKAKKAAKAPTSNIAKDIMAAYRAKQAADLAKEQAAAASVESTPVTSEAVLVPSPEPLASDVRGTTEAPTASIEVTMPAQENAIDVVDAAGAPSSHTAPLAEGAANGAASTPVSDMQPPVSLEDASVEKVSASDGTSTTAQNVGDIPALDHSPNGVPAEAPAADLPAPTLDAAIAHTPIETSRINTKAKSARPLTLWSQPIEGMTRGGREENAILASRAACIICLTPADHFQKDCPEVKKGRVSLQSLLQVRREQMQAEKEELAKRAALRKTTKGKKTMEEDGENLGITTESVETIERWVERLKRLDAVKERVTNGRQDTSPKVASHPIVEQNSTPTTSTPTGDHSSPSNRGAVIEAEVGPVSSPVQSPQRSTAGAGLVQSLSLPASSQTIGDQSSPREENMANSLAHSNGEEIPVPLLQTPTEEEAMSSFPLHQLALQRMNKKKRPGSLSGLSASDAVIETGDSDTDSSDSDSMSMTRSPIGSILGRMDDTDSGSDFDSIDSEDESGPGLASDPLDAHEVQQEDGEDGDNEDSGPSSRSPSVSDSGSESGSGDSRSHSSSSSSSRSSSPSSDSLADDPEASFRHFFSQPLSAKEKKRARLSAASATPSQTLDLEMEIDEPPYIEDIEEDETPVPSQARARRGSDSSIDVGHADEDEEKMDVDDEILPASLTHPPTFVQSDIETDDTASEADPTDAKRHSRSFVGLAREAGPSPTVDDFEGAIALKEAIAEEAMPQVLVEETIEDKRPRHVVSQGLPSPPSSQEEDIVATQLKDESMPIALRGRLGRGRVPSSLPMESSQESQPASSQLNQPDSATQPSQPTQTLRRSTRGTASTPTSPVQASRQVSNGQAGSEGIRRRLRSASREIPDVVVPPRVTRRAAAASQDPASPIVPSSSLPNGTPKGRRKASATASPDVNRRMTRSRSQVTPDRPSINTAPPSSSVNGLQLELIEEQETPKAVKFGSVNATPISQLDERESSAAIPEGVESDSGTEANTPTAAKGHAALTQRSPLFMSQGSQPLATQHYTLVDSSLPSEPLNRNSSRTDLRTTSPIVEENEDESQHESGGDVDDADDAESRQSSSDEDNDIPFMRPIHPIRRTASQGPPALAMPTLSSLDTSLLRARSARVANRTGMSASQPTPKTNKMGMRVAESESEVSSSSDEDEVPPERRGRYATGRKTKEKAKTNGVMRGW